MNRQQSFDARYLQQYRKRNPAKQQQWRINSAVRLLEKNGYTVLPPSLRKKPEAMSLEELEDRFQSTREKNNEYCRRWREAHKEQIREYNRRYKEQHPELRSNNRLSHEKQREYAAKWREANREKLREYQRKYYAEHREQAAETNRKWRAKNPDYAKKRWAEYKKALAKAKREQQARIRREIKAFREQQKGGGQQ